MEEINPNKNNNDLNIFKEEILSQIKELEKKITTQIFNKESKLNQDYQEFTSKINSLIVNNKEMVSNLVSQKLKLEKISELESFKNKVDDMLITHEVRIKNSIEDIERMKTKYDKIITDNLYVSGFIGNSCQFRNISEYLAYNISEVSKLKLEREQYKKDMKEVKNKLDGTMKNMISLNDNSVKLCNKYTDNKQEEFRKLLETTQTELNHKSMEMKAMIVQFHNESDIKINNLKKEFNKLLDMKDDFNNLIEEKYISFVKKYEELNEKVNQTNENMDNTNKKLDDANEQIINLDKSIKELSFQVRNYYCVNNKIAGLLEQLGANPSNSEIAKLLLGIPGNSINAEEKKTNKALLSMSVSPQPKRKMPKKNSNLDFVQLKLDDSVQINNNNLNNINNNNNINSYYTNYKPKKMITKSVINFSSDKKAIFNKIGLKKINLINDQNSESESSTINNLDDTANKNDIKDNKNNEKTKQAVKPILKQNLKQNIKDTNIKQSVKEKENEKENSKENEKINIKKENVKVNFKDNIQNDIKPNISENQKDNIQNDIKPDINENIKDNNIKEKPNTSRQIVTSLKKSEINSIRNNNTNKDYLPSLALGKKSESLDEIKRINLSAANIDKINNKKNLMMIIDNDNKIKQNYQKNIMRKIDLELEQDKQACKVVSLNLPADTLTKPSINITKKKKGINENKGKYDVVNSLINEYRAKLFSKAHSPEAMTNITNELLDIPKKVSQAFGRTTYTFYFKKDAIDCANANKNINNFGYNGPKRGYKFKNNKRIDTGDFKTFKKNQI